MSRITGATEQELLRAQILFYNDTFPRIALAFEKIARNLEEVRIALEAKGPRKEPPNGDDPPKGFHGIFLDQS